MAVVNIEAGADFYQRVGGEGGRDTVISFNYLYTFANHQNLHK